MNTEEVGFWEILVPQEVLYGFANANVNANAGLNP